MDSGFGHVIACILTAMKHKRYDSELHIAGPLMCMLGQNQGWDAKTNKSASVENVLSDVQFNVR